MITERIADQALKAIETGVDRGRHVLDRLASLTPAARRSRQRQIQRRALWIDVGILAGAAVLLLSGRRPHASADDQSGRRPRAFAEAGSERLREVMVADVDWIGPHASVIEAAQAMRQKNVGVLPIVEGDQVVGVITDRDLVVRALAQRGVDLETTRVRDCATANPVLAMGDWTTRRALDLMAEHQVGRLPVVDERGHLVGMVTLSSLALRSGMPDETLEAARRVSLRSARDDAA